MALKLLIFALLLVVCNGDSEEPFMTMIEGTGSEKFFKAFFEEINNNEPNKIAIFVLEDALFTGNLELPVVNWQVREFNFAFKHTDVKKVFGFKNAHERRDCVPENVNFENDIMTFDKLVSEIERLFKKHDRRYERNRRKQTESFNSNPLQLMSRFGRQN